MGIQNFDSENAIVEAEYRSIDILVRNQSKQAVIIENKIYAGDQDEQLWRYHQRMQVEGYREIWTTYLTLDGAGPSEQSSKSLPVILLSYETEIIAWLKDCIPLVAREPGVRESVFQYIELLQKLTSSDQGEVYMSKLKEQILQGENLFVIADINHAFKSVLADLQFDIWERMAACQASQYPYLGSQKLRPRRKQFPLITRRSKTVNSSVSTSPSILCRAASTSSSTTVSTVVTTVTVSSSRKTGSDYLR